MREKGAKTSKLFMRTTLSLTKNCCNATLFDESPGFLSVFRKQERVFVVILVIPWSWSNQHLEW